MGEFKGQIYLIDILVSLLVMSIVVALAVSFSAVEVKNSEDTTLRNDMLTSGLSGIELLIGSPGVPSDWEGGGGLAAGVSSIGLAKRIGGVTYRNDLDTAKLDAFVAMPYNASKAMMGMGGSSDYYFTITDGNGALLASKGTDAPEAGNVYAFTRYCTWNGTSVIVGLKVYGIY